MADQPQRATFYGGPLDGQTRLLPTQDGSFETKAIRYDRRWLDEAPPDNPIPLRTYTYLRSEDEIGRGPGGANVFRLVLREDNNG